MVMMLSLWCRFSIWCLLLTPLSHFKAGNDNGSLVAFNLIKLKTADPVNSLIKCFWDDIHAMVTSQPRCDRLGWDWFCSSEATHSVSIHIVHMGRWKSLFCSLSMYTFRHISFWKYCQTMSRSAVESTVFSADSPKITYTHH